MNLYLHNKCSAFNYTDRSALTSSREGGKENGFPALDRVTVNFALHFIRGFPYIPSDARNIHRDGAAAHRFFFFGRIFCASPAFHLLLEWRQPELRAEKKCFDAKKILIHHIS
jgi:hypothetical protein